MLDARDREGLTLLGRLAPAVSTIEQARAALRVVTDTPGGRVSGDQYRSNAAGRARDAVPGRTPRTVRMFQVIAAMFLALSGLLLVIASANIANDPAGAGHGAQPGSCPCVLALGARRGRLIRQLFTESVVLAALGGGAAIPLLAVAASRADGARRSNRAGCRCRSASTSASTGACWRSAGRSLSLAGIDRWLGARLVCLPRRHQFTGEGRWVRFERCAAACGLQRASDRLSDRRIARAADLRRAVCQDAEPHRDDRSRIPHRRRDARPRRLEEPGLRRGTPPCLLHRISAAYRGASRRPPRLVGLWSAVRLHHRLRAAACRWGGDERRAAADRPHDERRSGVSRGNGYFSCVSGRSFDASDAAKSRPVAIANEALARQLWSDSQAIGRRVRLEAGGPAIEIVGVVANTKLMMLWESPRPLLLRPLAQSPSGSAVLQIVSRRSVGRRGRHRPAHAAGVRRERHAVRHSDDVPLPRWGQRLFPVPRRRGDRRRLRITWLATGVDGSLRRHGVLRDAADNRVRCPDGIGRGSRSDSP